MPGNPVTQVLVHDADQFATPNQFAFMATWYRLNEHFHYLTKNICIHAALQPELLVKIGHQLAVAKGIAQGNRVKRVSIKAKALAAGRIKPPQPSDMLVDVIGIPMHWRFVGAARKGFRLPILTPLAGDANVAAP